MPVLNFTEKDCYRVLEKYCNNDHIKLINFALVPISGDIHGFMGKHLHLKIKGQNGSQIENLQFFVKTLLLEHESIAKFATTGNVFNKEIHWYKFLKQLKLECPDFDVSFAPEYYHSGDNEFIVLEDLSSSGYRMSEDLSLDAQHLEVVIKCIARFHAASIVFEEIKSKKLGRQYQLTEDYGEWLQEAMYKNDNNYLGYKYIYCGLRALHSLIDLLPEKGLSAQQFKDKLTLLVDQAFEDSKPNPNFRNVWCNGDLWVKNIMFKYEDATPVDCKVFDFQWQRYNPPAHDLFFMIYESTTKEERQRNLEYYYEFYYKSLTKELNQFNINIDTIINKDEYDITCREVVPVIKLTKTLYATISVASQERIKKVMADENLYAKISFEDRTDFAVDAFNSEETYRNVLSDLIGDLRDILEHDKISVEDCHKILRKKLGTSKYELLEYKVTPFVKKLGFLGEHSNLKIKIRTDTYKGDNKELSFFIKTMPQAKGQRNYVIRSRLFFKEMKWHTTFVPEMLANNISRILECLPNCYLARMNDVLVFDDYSDEGYITLNSRIPYDYETVVCIIKTLVKFHAATLILEEKLSSSGRPYRFGDHVEQELSEPHYSDLRESKQAMNAAIKGTLAVIDLFPLEDSEFNLEVFKDCVIKIFNKFPEYVKPSKKYRNTICHGDLWSNNILLKFFHDSPTNCLFVDFQTTRYNPPAYDLISFLFLSTDRKFRAQYMPDVINIYYQEIAQIFKEYDINVIQVLPYQEFLQSCHDAKTFSAAQTMSHFQNIMLSSEQIQELFADPEAGRQTMFENRSPFILKTCASDPVYKEKMYECVLNLKDVYKSVIE